MKLDINTGSDDKIIAFEGDNLLKNESIILIQDDNIVDLTGLTCDIAYVDTKSLSGDIIENLKIPSPTEGKIELPINSNLTKKDGIYDCELRLKSSSNGYVKFTAFFSLIIKANVFNRIGNKILSNDSFTKIQEILNKADGYNKDIEDKLNTIKSLDNSNIEAKNNINVLTVNIKNASAINDNLVKNTATAEEKNTTLNNSLEETKKYINGLDGSQNIPQIRIDLDTLQNGLKSNQELAYEGTNLKCENTLDGRIEDIVLEGMTYKNFEGIKSVGEAEKNKINTLSCGNNLCAHLESGGTKGTDGDFGIDYNNPAYIRSNYINVEGIDYLACNVTNDKNSSIRFNLYCFYDSNKKGIKPYLSYKVGKVPQNAKYCRVEITTDGSTEDISSYIDTTKCIVIQDKIIPDKFKPYKSDERELKLPFEGGLKGIPNGAKDLIYNKEDGCYVRQNIEKRILNGTENITLDNFIVEKENQITFSIEIPSMLSSTSTNKMLNLFCDKFEVTREPISNSNLEGISKYQNCIRIHIFKNKLETQDVAGFKKWLQTNPVEIYYELATPIETKISDTKLSLDTYNALTYVFSNNAISPNIKLKVASNLGSIIQQNARSINDIYKLIDEVLIPQITTNTADIAILKLK